MMKLFIAAGGSWDDYWDEVIFSDTAENAAKQLQRYFDSQLGDLKGHEYTAYIREAHTNEFGVVEKVHNGEFLETKVRL